MSTLLFIINHFTKLKFESILGSSITLGNTVFKMLDSFKWNQELSKESKFDKENPLDQTKLE